MADEKNMVEEFEDDEIYTLTDEEGNEKEFSLLGAAEVEGVEYLALVPLTDGEPEEEYVILRRGKDANGEEVLETIDDDEEFDRIADLFEDQLFDEIDYDGENEEK